MEYTLILENGRCGGIVGVEPTHLNWTLTPYLGGLVKEFWNGSAWVESATQEEIAEANKALIPQKVTRRQLKQALVLAGIPMSSIDYAISQIADETEKALITIYWNDSTEFERYHPKLVEFAQALQISEEQADQLFILANTL